MAYSAARSSLRRIRLRLGGHCSGDVSHHHTNSPSGRGTRLLHQHRANISDHDQRGTRSTARTSRIRANPARPPCVVASGQRFRWFRATQSHIQKCKPEAARGCHMGADEEVRSTHGSPMDIVRRQRGRRRAFKTHGQRRLETASQRVPVPLPPLRQARDRSVRITCKRTGKPFLLTVQRQSSVRHRRAGNQMDFQPDVCKSPMAIDTRSASKVERRTAWNLYSGTATLASSLVVANDNEHGQKRTNDPNHTSHVLVGQIGQHSRLQATTLGRRSRSDSAAARSSFAVFLEATPAPLREQLTLVLRNSLAPATYRAYENRLKHYTDFCRAHSFNDVPASVAGLSAYLLHAQQQGLLSGGSFRQFSAALRKTHLWRGYPAPQSNAVVADLFAGFQRLSAAKVRRLKRAPLQVPQALRIAARLMQALRDKQTTCARDCALILFQFMTFARAITAAAQQTQDITISGQVISIRFNKEKNWFVQRTLLLQRTAREAFSVHPWDALTAWIKFAHHHHWRFLFSKHRKLQYQGILQAWSRALATASITQQSSTGKLLPHSARAGGASAAAAMGVATVVLAQRGGWRSTDSVISYIHPMVRHQGDTLFFGDLQPAATPISAPLSHLVHRSY